LARGRKADTGIFAESLIYYDSVYVHVDNPEQFAGFISLLVQQGLSYEALNELVEEGALRFLNTVMAMPFMGHGLGPRTIVSGFYTIQEKAMDDPGYFTKRFLEFAGLRNSFSNLGGLNQQAFDKFCQLAEKTAVTFSHDDIGQSIADDAYRDFLDPDRCKLITKNILNELYRINQLGKVPDFKVEIREIDSNYEEVAQNSRSAVIGRNSSGGSYKAYEVDFSIRTDNLRSLEDKDKPIITFTTLPLSCAGVANIYIKSAGKLKCDLFLPRPISRIVGNKLYEINDRDVSESGLKVKSIIEKLEAKVEFPDLWRFVNADKVDFNKVLEIRRNAKRFRAWLQTEAERDRDAIIAYHSEVARQSGFANVGKKSLKIFGFLLSLASSISTEILLKEDVVTKETLKTVGGKAIESLFDYGAKKLGVDWKPVCFGDWYKDEISRLLEGTGGD
jgi:hypothetical protein